MGVGSVRHEHPHRALHCRCARVRRLPCHHVMWPSPPSTSPCAWGRLLLLPLPAPRAWAPLLARPPWRCCCALCDCAACCRARRVPWDTCGEKATAVTLSNLLLGELGSGGGAAADHRSQRAARCHTLRGRAVALASEGCRSSRGWCDAHGTHTSHARTLETVTLHTTAGRQHQLVLQLCCSAA
jgi:hypothetical protein